MKIEQLFFELIRVAIGTQDTLTQPPSAKDWNALYNMAKKQSLVGVCFAALQRIVEHKQEPPEMLYLTWLGMAAKIQQRNEIVNRQCVELQAKLSADGLQSCILKGQGVAQLYSEPLRGLRQCGDIDVWVNASLKDIKKWIEKIHPLNHCDYMHTLVHIFPDTEVELHYRPWISRNLIRNHRLQKIAEKYNSSYEECKALGITIPCSNFNILHQLNHIYWHLTVEGVGLRQMLDLYFTIKNHGGAFVLKEVEYQKLKKFTSAAMWVLGYVFGMEEKAMLCKPNEKEGKFLLGEILRAGNFGHYDDRLQRHAEESKNSIVYMWIKHVTRLFKHYPEDVLWTPIGIVFLSIAGRLQHK